MGKQKAKTRQKPSAVGTAGSLSGRDAHARAEGVTNTAMQAAVNSRAELEEAEFEADVARAAAEGGVRTTNPALQARLEELVGLAAAGDVAGFCGKFVPLDLPPEDADFFVQELLQDRQRWDNLVAEIQAIAGGVGVVKIKGNQRTRAEFVFHQLNNPQIMREVEFVCTAGDWRAQG